ncbi:hypothetical protein CFP65_5900 [Kitasatospora sp. MMS16-BH015]|uniref:alpha/beta hydrolase n=1 Tax=Kitasatospora sp. MMS16-BH015 TaxID=2018025 RepID=UPI000CA33ADA|nr:alpha/beta hydrolase [Kitasatospora sp. MMS16-BH015]AUG80580.1 hypothetical protein CFP65_5900 [Kitasatospora sp. MMS16-BH015]
MSAIGLAELRDTDFAVLYRAAEAYERLHEEFGGHADAWDGAVADRVRASGWRGEAGEAAGRALLLTTGRLRAAQAELGMVGEVLRGAADALLLAQSQLRQALAEAREAGYGVDADGEVAGPELPEGLAAAQEHDLEERSAAEDRRQEYRARIAAARAQAERADRAADGQLRHHIATAHQGAAGLTLQSAATHRLGPADAPFDALRKALPGPDATPAAVHAWWLSLTPVGREHLLRTHPELLGDRDGLPAAVRDQANRVNLRTLIDGYARKAELSGEERELLAGLRAVRDRLATATGSRPPLLLLGVGATGQGRAVLSWGDPDTARHTCAYVPGLGTTVAAVAGRDADRALHVWQAAERADPAAGTASVVWLGYDPPPGLDRFGEQGLDPAEVLSTERAERGATSYARFLAGLRAAHQGDPAHVTALGHSYGSTTVGLAARLPGGIAAQEVVLVGSPGVGADRADQLAADPGHVWVGEAENDPVTRLPAPRDAAARLLGGVLTAKLGESDQRYFGADPAGEAFGARRFRVADGPAGSFASHSDYLDGPDTPGTLESVDNIGRIVTGQYERVTTQPAR